MPNEPETTATAKTEVKDIKPFLWPMGSDPEFNYIFNNKKIDAEVITMKLFKGDPFVIEGVGEVGTDGNATTAEFRIKPNKYPRMLVEEIGKLVELVTNKTKILTLSTLSYKGSIGGHIHFQMPDDKRSESLMEMANKILSTFYIPISLSEDKINLLLRLRQSYGEITDWRYEERDNKLVFEFRMPTAEWMTTPRIMYSTFAYLGTVFHEIWTHPKSFNKKLKDIIYRNETEGKSIQNLSISKFSIILEVIVKLIKSEIKKFEFYPQYKDEINFILNPKEVLKEKKQAEYDMAIGWGLRKNKIPGIKELNNSKKIHEEITNNHLSTLSQILKINYNKDTNTSAFATELTNRCIALSWKLNNTYCLFGLRKGIKDFLAFDNKENIILGKELIANDQDLQSLADLMYKMRENHGIGKSSNNQIIFLGIPFADRIKLDFKPFLKSIIAIEKSKKNNWTKFSDLIHDDALRKSEAKPILSVRFQINKNGSNYTAITEEDDNFCGRSIEVSTSDIDAARMLIEQEQEDDNEEINPEQTTEEDQIVEELDDEDVHADDCDCEDCHDRDRCFDTHCSICHPEDCDCDSCWESRHRDEYPNGCDEHRCEACYPEECRCSDCLEEEEEEDEVETVGLTEPNQEIRIRPT